MQYYFELSSLKYKEWMKISYVHSLLLSKDTRARKQYSRVPNKRIRMPIFEIACLIIGL